MVPLSFGCGSAVFAAIATLAPSRAARRAIASPMPRLPPDTNSVLPFSDVIAPSFRCFASISSLVPTFRSSYTISAITFYELRKAMGTSKFMLLVPLFDLKSLGSFRRLRCRDFKSAALVRWMVLAALLTASGACTIGPDFTAPVAPLAEQFRGADNRSVQSGSAEYERWWYGLQDPTLNRLMQIAYNQNLTLQSAGTRVLQARAALGIAVGVTYPQVQQGAGSVIY